MTFTKLFSSITESSIWMQDDQTRIVWVAMLAMADRRGRVWAAIPGLANRARVPLAAAEKAIACFLAPDPYSRTKDHDGRRIEEIDGGWRLLNYEKYRNVRDDEDQRAKDAERQRRHRAKSAPVTPMSRNVTRGNDNAEAEAEADTPKGAASAACVGFEAFWEAYPKKVAKPAALKSYRAAIKSGATIEAILEGVKRWASTVDWSKDSGQYIPHPSTFLSQQRWMDSPQVAAVGAEFCEGWRDKPHSQMTPRERVAYAQG
ncbi:MAG: hypothetical protein EBS05_20005 [Proteobacteria bacterium]|nr:hypothetical protein [Pseudomonadota bacterium]